MDIATGDASPIIYIHSSVDFAELTAFYRIADICLITSRRDGMNLVAEEFVACQKDRYGVLVLSEFVGAATFMSKGSIIFNPSSLQRMSDSIYRAATMSLEEKKRMHLELEKFVTTNTRYVFESRGHADEQCQMGRGIPHLPRAACRDELILRKVLKQSRLYLVLENNRYISRCDEKVILLVSRI